MKKTIFLLLIFNISSLLFAQGQAFTKHPITKEEYATAIEKNDKTILRIDCEKLVQAVQNAWPELKIRDKNDLADYIRSLVEISGPIGPAKFSRVFKDGTVDFNWTRDVKKGEILLFDNNRAEFMFSLSCGNMTFGVPVSNVFKKTEEEKFIPLSMLSQLQIPGPPGKDGYTPIKGIDYNDGAKGEKGEDGSSTTGYIAIGVTIVGIVVAVLVNNRHTTNNYTTINNPPVVTPPAGTPPGGQTTPAFRFSFGL
ncbi:MAG: hypothetical protein NDI62_00745 [Burkholderiales bacterium]|nr:hypothetical protein [Burkholderiales bacterium]